VQVFSLPEIRRIFAGEILPRVLPFIGVGSDAGAALSGPGRGALRVPLVRRTVPLRTSDRRALRGRWTGPSVPSLPYARTPLTVRPEVPGASQHRASAAMSRRADARAIEKTATIASRTPLHMGRRQALRRFRDTRSQGFTSSRGSARSGWNRSGRGGWRERAGYSHHGKRPRTRCVSNELQRMPGSESPLPTLVRFKKVARRPFAARRGA
jgi:hypothetical protein